MRAVTTALVLVLLGALVVAAPASATHPGANGPFVFSATDGTGIAVVTPDGAIEEVVDGAPIHLEVSPDGRTILHTGTTDSRDISIVSLAGGPTQVVVPRDGAGGRPDVSWSPDGTRIVVADGATVTVYDADGTNPVPLLDTATDPNLGTTIDAVLWTAADEIIAIQRFRESGVRIDMATGDVTYLESPTGLRFDTQYGIDSSPDGQQLTITCIDDSADQAVGVCVLARDLGVIRFIPPSVVGMPRIDKPAWSPDGSRIAFVGVDFATDAAGLFTSTPEGTDAQQIAPLPARPGSQGNAPTLQSWARVPDIPPAPLEEPPPPPSEEPLLCGGFDGDPATTERADFADPIAFAVAISQARFGCGPDDAEADHVVLSRDDAFADSLVGAALTGTGPLLFTQTDTLPPATAAEIQRLLDDGDRIYLLGGPAAISQAVADQLTAFDVRRLEGPSRVETSVAVASEVLALGGDDDTVALARADGPADNPTAAWADSVSAGAWTAAAQIPTLVTQTASLHPAVAAFLEAREPSRTVLLGGDLALSPAVEAAVPGPDRVAGDSRAGTAQAIARDLLAPPADGDRRLVVINGFRPDGWLFGLPAGGLAADAGGAIALGQDPVPPETLAMACDPSSVDILLAGSRTQLPDTVPTALDAAGPC